MPGRRPQLLRSLFGGRINQALPRFVKGVAAGFGFHVRQTSSRAVDPQFQPARSPGPHPDRVTIKGRPSRRTSILNHDPITLPGVAFLAILILRPGWAHRMGRLRRTPAPRRSRLMQAGATVEDVLSTPSEPALDARLRLVPTFLISWSFSPCSAPRNLARS